MAYKKISEKIIIDQNHKKNNENSFLTIYLFQPIIKI